MNKMLRYLSDYKRESVLAPLFKMLEATFDLFVPLVMADIVNVGIAAHDFHYILVRCGILLLLAIVGLTCSLTAQYFSAKAAVGYSTGLRHALFEHIQTLSFSEMDTMGTSTLITRMTSDVNQVQSGLNLFLRLFLRSIFASEYRIVEAVDGMQGWSKALKFLPDIIISDVMMPGKDGITMTRELRADMTTSHIPIVLLTAKTSIESKLEGLEYGADDYITKPFSATYLKARVKNLLTQRRKLQGIYRDNLMTGNATVDLTEETVEEQGPEMSPNDRKFMDKLVELMEKNMDNGELVVDDLVQELAVSRSVFFKKLKTLTGLAPIEFIKEMRIKRAVQFIETGEYSMTQISYMVGINDPRYFSKCFKQKMGMTPTEYRDKGMNKINSSKNT